MWTTVTASAVSGLLSMLGTWIFHQFFPVVRNAPVSLPTNQAAPISAQPLIDLSNHAQSAGLDKFVGLFKALETMNGPFILSEARALSSLVAHYGGIAPLIEDAVNQVLEARLSAGQSALLDKLAAASGVTSRELLDALENKPGAASAILAVKGAAATP